MARFRDVFEFVDGAISAGVSRVAARDELASLGLDLKLNTFIVFLRRLRKERSARSISTPSGPRAAVTDAAATPTTATAASVPTPPRAVDASRSSLYRPATDEGLPKEWRTMKLTPEQAALLTPEQKRERRKARDALFDPNPYDPPSS